jgi:hypothetical protein
MKPPLAVALAVVSLATPAAAAEPATERADCPSLEPCCVPGEQPCHHPGAARGALAALGGAGLGLGVTGFVLLGDSLGSGDPYGGLAGASFVGLTGVGLGALVAALTARGETSIEDRPGRPTLRVGLTPGGTRTFDEADPWGLRLSIDPSIHLHDALTLQPHLGLSLGLGTRVDVDPRPQLQRETSDQQGTFTPVLRRRTWKFSGGAELAVRLPYPMPVARPARTGPFEVRWRPTVEVRRRVWQPGTDKAQIVESVGLHPALVGFRWHLSPRQRFTVLAGPRIDWIGFSDPGETTIRRGPPVQAAFYGEAWYQIDVPMTPLGQGKAAVSGRLNLGYVHSMLDGQSLEFGPMVGFLGPMNVSFDLRVRRREAPVALQVTAGWWIGVGGGPYVELGLVAPDLRPAGGEG